jgi:hypothetical protein
MRIIWCLHLNESNLWPNSFSVVLGRSLQALQLDFSNIGKSGRGWTRKIFQECASLSEFTLHSQFLLAGCTSKIFRMSKKILSRKHCDKKTIAFLFKSFILFPINLILRVLLQIFHYDSKTTRKRNHNKLLCLLCFLVSNPQIKNLKQQKRERKTIRFKLLDT